MVIHVAITGHSLEVLRHKVLRHLLVHSVADEHCHGSPFIWWSLSTEHRGILEAAMLPLIQGQLPDTVACTGEQQLCITQDALQKYCRVGICGCSAWSKVFMKGGTDILFLRTLAARVRWGVVKRMVLHRAAKRLRKR